MPGFQSQLTPRVQPKVYGNAHEQAPYEHFLDECFQWKPALRFTIWRVNEEEYREMFNDAIERGRGDE